MIPNVLANERTIVESWRASFNYRERSNEKVSLLRMLVGGPSQLTRGSSGSEVSREIFPRNRNCTQPDTGFYYSHRCFFLVRVAENAYRREDARGI